MRMNAAAWTAVVVTMAAAMVGCGEGRTAARIGQINDALHAYPDVAEAWVFMPLDASVYAEQRFGIGRPIWMLMHIEKKGVSAENANASAVDP